MSNRFKARVFVSASLLLLFGVMLTTSVLMFVQSHTTTTALMHTVLGTVLLLFIFWHLKNNLAALRQHLKLKSAGGNGFNGAMSAAFVLGAGLIGAAFFQWLPLANFYQWGASLRSVGGDHRQTLFTYVKLDTIPNQAKGPLLRIDLRSGPSFAWPQYAFWLETMDGKLIQPLYVTRKLAESRFDTKVVRKADGLVFTSNPLDSSGYDVDSIFEFIDEPTTTTQRTRLESLPVFLHKIAEAANSSVGPAIDGHAGATIQQSFLLSTRTQSPAAHRYRIRFEINQSFDFNPYYSSDRFPDDPVYSGNGYSAQPSLIYEAVIDPGSDHRYYPMRLIGRGHHSGRNGEIHPDLQNMTSALEIVDRIIIEIPVEEVTL